ncbi:MAG TPA: peptidoglycan editing factor PgeF [Flexivirga sp.]|uniref:peptidoglycan editing factor PgeF n=1 Tax=Flexivirga sp. TaxID=1962927 RepID=UPI002B6B1AD1|nr:peptidoglycan editing factor PgeF [Flexivirga sp.]HWC20899.1 peptidoglycan editing factor PgeF [Flexivirga sp.]
MWWWRDQLTGPGGRVVDVGFTDTAGGVSPAGPIASLNLGGNVGDDPSNVVRNRGAVAAAVDVSPEDLVFMRQTHSDRVVSLEDGHRDPEGDGIVTSSSGVALAVLVADCTPVLLADPAAGVIGAVHAGRPGMMARIVDRALDRMSEHGATNPVAIIGPSVCGRCYEVPLELREEAAAITPESRTVSWTGTPAIDVAGGVVAQLHARGVDTTWVPGCTRESDRLFSHRRDHRSGRFAGVIVQRGADV